MDIRQEPIITCAGLCKGYGRGGMVLKGLELTVPAGVVFALLGTNGAGKTTLIRTILGLMPRSGGRIRVLGQDPWEAGPSLREKIGYVSEEQSLYGWMRVSQLIRFCRGLYIHWNQELVDEYLQKFSIAPATRISTMSKGQKVRLALILALAPEPDLLILDEPMNGLDPLAQHEFLRIVQEAAIKQGRTTFFSTHNLSDVEAIATHLAILAGGTIRIAGDMQAVRQSVRRLRVPGQRPGEVPAGAFVLESGEHSTTYLVPCGTEGGREVSAAGSPSARAEESPATLQDVFIYYCAGRDMDESPQVSAP